MNRTVVLAFLGFSAAFGLSGALAGEGDDAATKVGNQSRLMTMAASPVRAEGLPAHAFAKIAPLDQRAMRSNDENALMAGADNARPVIDGTSLVDRDQHAMLRSSNPKLVGSGFAPIKAALAASNDSGERLTRSATSSASHYLHAPK